MDGVAARVARRHRRGLAPAFTGQGTRADFLTHEGPPPRLGIHAQSLEAFEIIARVICGMLSPKLFRSVLKIEGEAGTLIVLSPFQPHWFNRVTIKDQKGTRREKVSGENSYVLQLRAFQKAIRGRMKLNTDPADAVGNMRLIDTIYEKAGLKKRGT